MADQFSGSPRGSAEETVGQTLKAMRQHAGLTGQQLARRARMSQAKISRIETGVTIPAAEDIDLLCAELGATAARTAAIRERANAERAEPAPPKIRDWRLGGGGPAARQEDIGILEAGTTELRAFQPNFLPGLLQTSEYIRAVMMSLQPLTEDAHRPTLEVVAAAVSARIQRQQVLADPGRRFQFLLGEAALRNRMCRPEDMVAQIERLRDVAEQDNVSLRVLPFGSRWPAPPIHGFELLDRDQVIVDLFNTSLVLREADDVDVYHRVFAMLDEQATPDTAPVLDDYRQLYLKLAADS